MTVFVSDTFTDSDATALQDHTPEVGGGWTVRSGITDITIQSNAAESSGSSAIYTCDATPGAADYDIGVDVLNVDSLFQSVRIYARFQDTNNFYRYTTGHNSNWQIRKKVAGVWTVLDSGPPASHDAAYSISCECRTGVNGKKLIKDGDGTILQATDDDLADAGKAGFRVSGNTVIADNYEADDTGAPPAENAYMSPMKVWWPH